jgi:hypothetical protein
MFGRRKPKIEEEDSLVPHGLVWQAMTEPERPGDDGDGDPAPAIGPTVPPVPPTGPSPDPPLPAPLLPKEAASNPVAAPSGITASVIPSPPIVSPPSVSPPQPFWRSLKREQATDRLSAENQATHATRSAARSIRALVAIRASVASSSKALSAFAERALDGTREYVKKMQPLFLRTQRQLTRASNLSAAWAANTGAQTRNFVAARAAKAMAQIRIQTGNLRIHTAKSFDWVATHAKRQPRPVQLPLLDLRPANREGWKPLARKARLGFVALPVRTRLLVIRTMAEMRMPSRGALPQSSSSSSFRTLAIVASLALVLVTGLVSATRHYAAASLPSHYLDITSASASTVSEPEPPAALSSKTALNSAPNTAVPSPAGSTAAPADMNTTKVTKPAEISKTSQVQLKRPAAEPTVRPKRHRTEDDDYVARDTYVYYGNRRTSSR